MSTFTPPLEAPNDQVSLIVATMLDKCYKEKLNKSPQLLLENIYERVSFYTGLPQTFIYNVKNNGEFKDSHQLNIWDLLLLMESIQALLEEIKLPTIKNVHAEYRKRIKQKQNVDISLLTFQMRLANLGYVYRKSLKGPFIIIEKPSITFKRYNYINRIKQLRKKNDKMFYYIDMKIFEANKASTETDVPPSSTFVFFYMVSSISYENGLFTTEIKAEVFNQWISDILLPSLKPSSVIVICNNGFRESPKTITRYHSKDQMQQWLKDNDTPFLTSMNKAELFELIDKCTEKSKSNDVDGLLQAHGHEVLHLPSYLNYISPTRLMYDYVSSLTNIKPYMNINEVKQSTLDLILPIPESKWIKFEKKVISTENIIFNLDTYIDKHFDAVCELDSNYIIESPSVCNLCNIKFRN